MEALDVLVTAAQQGDLEAFGAIVKRFQGMAYASAYAMLSDAHLAEDITQEAFIEAFLNLPKLREPEAFPGWFRRIIFKQGDRLTRGKHVATVPLEAGTASDVPRADLNPARIVENGEMQDVVQRAITTLPEHERIVTQLYYISGYALKDIAGFLELPVSTIKKRLFDARKRLRSKLILLAQDMFKEQYHATEAHFSARVQLLIAIRIGDPVRVRAMFERDPYLVNGNLGWRAARTQEEERPARHPVDTTALKEAIKYGHNELVTLLLDYGARIDARASDGLAPLHDAVLYKQTEIVTLLLARGAPVATLSSAGLTPLHIAVMRGDLALTEHLLSHGSPVDTEGNAGRTPLHWAALKGQLAIVSLLLQHGAAPYARDEAGQTPLSWARERGHHEIVDLLKLRGYERIKQ